MRSSISHFTGKEQNELNHIVKRIVENIAPESIYLYGSRTTDQLSRSFFTDKARREDHRSMYDLVIIIRDDEKLEEEAIRQFAGNIINRYAKASIILHRRGFLINRIVEGNFFFSWLPRFAIVLYHKGPMPTHCGPKGVAKARASLFAETYPGVKQFLANARAYLSSARERQKEKVVALALYMAKQSIENACQAMIYGLIGYLAPPHDLPRLFDLTLNFTEEVAALFPCDTREETRLFDLLTASSGTAHIDQLKNPTGVELIILLDRAEQLLALADRLIQKRTAGLLLDCQSPAATHTPHPTQHANNYQPAPAGAVS